jgi:predicted metallopeptidase
MTVQQVIDLLKAKISRLEGENKVLIQELQRIGKDALNAAKNHDKEQNIKKDYPSF